MDLLIDPFLRLPIRSRARADEKRHRTKPPKIQMLRPCDVLRSPSRSYSVVDHYIPRPTLPCPALPFPAGMVSCSVVRKQRMLATWRGGPSYGGLPWRQHEGEVHDQMYYRAQYLRDGSIRVVPVTTLLISLWSRLPVKFYKKVH
jgi:hypothetical protein